MANIVIKKNKWTPSLRVVKVRLYLTGVFHAFLLVGILSSILTGPARFSENPHATDGLKIAAGITAALTLMFIGFAIFIDFAPRRLMRIAFLVYVLEVCAFVYSSSIDQFGHLSFKQLAANPVGIAIHASVLVALLTGLQHASAYHQQMAKPEESAQDGDGT